MQESVASEVKQKEVVWLEAIYPNSQSPGRMLGLQLKPRTPNVQGAVLLLHDANEHANWPRVIRPIREALPDQGWHTLSITLPNLLGVKNPERSLEPKSTDTVLLTATVSESLLKAGAKTRNVEGLDVAENDELAEEAAPEIPSNEVAQESQEESVDIDLAGNDLEGVSYNDRALAHLEAGMAHLKSMGYQNIVMVAVGMGADIALEYIRPQAESMPAQGFAVIMIDPKLKDLVQEDIGEAFARGFRSPVLDVYDQVSLESREKAKERMIGARLANMQDYSQLKLNSNDFSGTQTGLVRRVSQWMLKHAPGMQAQQYKIR